MANANYALCITHSKKAFLRVGIVDAIEFNNNNELMNYYG